MEGVGHALDEVFLSYCRHDLSSIARGGAGWRHEGSSFSEMHGVSSANDRKNVDSVEASCGSRSRSALI
ncbi:hypothetical protein ACPOL_1786 [Acidisarcina polymorpha]|uniref:Uncharacterized protein n=1 Tax=Acidisarcina polymorpha TaxID=2211140 RepID=A0A2Z5FW93_9BACT|nr:hypothetical protein ACPOL_1786 [Acidisarcina polymorpha]